jgi:hypothetical protein
LIPAKLYSESRNFNDSSNFGGDREASTAQFGSIPLFLHPFSLFLEKYAGITVHFLIMRFPVQMGSFQRPVHLISRRALSTSIPRLDASDTSQHHVKKGSFPTPPRSGDAEREKRNLGKNLRAVLQSGARGNAVSSPGYNIVCVQRLTPLR